MGIDHTKKQHIRNSQRQAPKSANPQLALLVQLYRVLARRTDSELNKTVLQSLYLSKTNRPPVSTADLATELKKGSIAAGKIVVVVGTVTDDPRLLEVPKVTVAALRFTATARARIVKAGGEALTLDQLARRTPTGEDAVLVKGDRARRQAVRHFGFGPNSKKAPRVLSKGRKFERARGRRHSRAFKV
ncbi:60S ribosomal protein eL18 [Magnusiomyces paraingens]|uniref:Large ribosomal subunit protein uL15/eL18 domain-containing protein n=1 Tax=Magnusiomyces paraingens TaxID=2606893 RepID=A0A5E8BY78_9ASCO|nr:uncharacterized protein SAPINGB_P004671 [Saprochaete ingens]VVT55624.1 unnamed protein product [Saprochaete ingens]